MNTHCHYAPSKIRPLELRGNNYVDVSTHHRLARANSQRAAQRLAGAYLLPPSLTLSSGSNSSRHGKSKPARVNRRNTDRIADALSSLRSSKRRRKHSKRDPLWDAEDDDSETSLTSDESYLSSDESESSVGSVENLLLYPGSASEQSTTSNNRQNHIVTGSSLFSANTAAHMDSSSDWTTGILPPLHGTRDISVLPFSGRNGHSDRAVHPFLTSVDPEALETREGRNCANHRKNTVVSPNTLC